MSYRVAVLGGLGLMAEAALQDLARQPDVDVVLAVDMDVARKARLLSNIPQRRKVRVLRLDVKNTSKAARALRGVDGILNAAWYEINLKAMDLALSLRAHYVDLGGLYHTTLRQLKRNAEFKRKGVLGVLGCGSSPGITNMMVAQASKSFSSIGSVGIYDASYEPAIEGGFLPPFSIRTLLDEYSLEAPILKAGRIIEATPHSGLETLRFPRPIGICRASAVIHSELATLPAYLRSKGIRNMAFKIAYPEALRSRLDLLVSMGFGETRPLEVNGAWASPRAFLTAMSQRNIIQDHGKPSDFDVLRIRMQGDRFASAARHKTVMEWDCELFPSGNLSAGGVGVGFSASTATLMVLRGESLCRLGVYAPESVFSADTFLDNLRKHPSILFRNPVFAGSTGKSRAHDERQS